MTTGPIPVAVTVAVVVWFVVNGWIRRGPSWAKWPMYTREVSTLLDLDVRTADGASADVYRLIASHTPTVGPRELALLLEWLECGGCTVSGTGRFLGDGEDFAITIDGTHVAH
jgi:hypothetical protein